MPQAAFWIEVLREPIRQSFWQLGSLLLPFVAYACFTRDSNQRIRGVAITSYSAILAAAALLGDRWTGHVPVLAGLLYFIVAAAATSRLPSLLRNGNLTTGGLFVACCTLFMIVPAVWVTNRAWAYVVVFMGWYMTLSSYSYCIEAASSKKPPGLTQAVFFIVVDPVLVYPQRSKRVSAPRLDLVGLSRIAQGVTAWIVRALIFDGIHLVMPEPPVLLPLTVVSYLSTVFYFGGAALGLYFALSGVASVQIGAMRLIGYSTPECYRMPFLAVSPMDFWRRWNLWVGQWAMRYLYFPISFHVSRRLRGHRAARTALAIVVTFVSVGVLHDIYHYLAHLTDPKQPASMAYTFAFLIFALLFVAWSGLTEYSRVFRRGSHARPQLLEQLSVVASWVVFAQVGWAMAWLTLRNLIDPLLSSWFSNILSLLVATGA